MFAIKSPSARSDERRPHIYINLAGVRDVTVLSLSIELTNIPIMSDL